MSTPDDRDRSWVEVDLSNLLHNARTVLAAAGGARLLPMVKANAYGVGVRPVVTALETLQPWGYGVATPAEGAQLRAAGIERPIVVFTPARPAQFGALRSAGLTPVLENPETIGDWGGPFHVEIDTGMGRAGIPWHDRDRIREVLRRSPEGLFTHFHSADEGDASVRTQEDRLKEITAGLGDNVLVHAQNSAGTFRSSRQYDLVRPGIFLYGGAVGHDMPAPRPVVALRCRLVSVRVVRPGETVSYGAAWSPKSQTVVGTLAIGYADGVRRSIAGRAVAIAAGRRVPVVGRVTMDMTMIDLGAEPVAGVGDEVTLVGAAGGEMITIDDHAGWAGTISYEVLTGLGPRLPRIY